MRINNNVTALNSHRQYGINASSIGKNVEKLSSGYRINRSADDAAGLAISEKMRAQIRGLNMASKNSQDGISLVQTAEGALQTAHDILQRMRELAVQSASDTNQNDVDREALNAEFQQLIAEVNDTASKTKFNNMGLIDGTYDHERGKFQIGDDGKIALGPREANGLTFTVQSGANMGDELKINIQRMDWNTVASLVSAAGADVSTTRVGDLLDIVDSDYKDSEAAIAVKALADAAGEVVHLRDRVNSVAAITIVNAAINVVSTQRSELGAIQNRLEFKIQNLDISAENLQAAESRIRDADMAKMMTEFTRNNILFQSSTAMLAQANMLPQGVLQLLG